jgi:hypothetical protein
MGKMKGREGRREEGREDRWLRRREREGSDERHHRARQLHSGHFLRHRECVSENE